jgi:hypothetical protein
MLPGTVVKSRYMRVESEVTPQVSQRREKKERIMEGI